MATVMWLRLTILRQVPTVSTGKILVNVKASGVNPADWEIPERILPADGSVRMSNKPLGIIPYYYNLEYYNFGNYLFFWSTTCNFSIKLVWHFLTSIDKAR